MAVASGYQTDEENHRWRSYTYFF